MIRRYSLRALLAGAAQLAIVLSMIGAKGAQPSIAPLAPLARMEVSGQRCDGDPDRVLVLSDDNPTHSGRRGPFPRALLNGESQPKPIGLRSGVTYMFRLINTRTDYAATVSIFDDGQLAEWRVVAKDGTDLPSSQAAVRAATLTFAAGEIYDVEFTPIMPGRLTLQFGAPKQGPVPRQATDVEVIVR